MKLPTINLPRIIQRLAYCLRHQDTPFAAKFLVFLLLAYIVSPIDLIPDFIPIFGLLDEIILIPVVMYLIYKMVPEEIIQQSDQVEANYDSRLMIVGVMLVLSLWLMLAVGLWYLTQ